MRDELLAYYERELTYVRRMATEFSEKYPKVAGRLLLEPGKCEDPHVERLIEAFALLAARIHLKLDDEFPEITEALLQVLYPHFLAPVPSIAVVQFVLDPDQGALSNGYTVDRHTTLYAKPSQGTICCFRTAYPTTIWPIEVTLARLETPAPVDAAGRAAPAALRLRLRTQGVVTFGELALDRLRFFLSGESGLAHTLYEALFGACTRVELRHPDPASPIAPITLPASCLSEVGFGADEGLLPYSSRSFPGYRLFQEYFSFPEKFLFADVSGLGPTATAGFDCEVDLVCFLSRAPRISQALEPQNFRLGCTCIVNLFPQTAEPIRLDHAHTEYRVIADMRRQLTTEVYSVDSVTGMVPQSGETEEYQPFYSFRHSFTRQKPTTFWHAARRPSQRKNDPGTEVFLSLVNLDFRPTLPAAEVLTVRTTATNRDLPGLLPFGDPAGDFQLEGAAPIKRIVCLVKPTPTERPAMGHRLQWRLISHLSLNYLSLVGEGADGKPEALQEILRLYDYAESPVVQQQIAGMTQIASKHVVRRIRTGAGSGLARGIEATIEFDESRYVGAGVYLFSSVVEKFLGLYVSINSFSELVATTRQRGLLKRWPPRSGQQALV
jgi:type VI secretion system protein ImpG